MAKKTQSEINDIHAALQENGWVKPFLTDSGSVWIYAGYGRWELLPQSDPRARLKLSVYQDRMCGAVARGNAGMLLDYLAKLGAERQSVVARQRPARRRVLIAEIALEAA